MDDIHEWIRDGPQQKLLKYQFKTSKKRLEETGNIVKQSETEKRKVGWVDIQDNHCISRRRGPKQKGSLLATLKFSYIRCSKDNIAWISWVPYKAMTTYFTYKDSLHLVVDDPLEGERRVGVCQVLWLQPPPLLAETSRGSK